MSLVVPYAIVEATGSIQEANLDKFRVQIVIRVMISHSKRGALRNHGIVRMRRGNTREIQRMVHYKGVVENWCGMN